MTPSRRRSVAAPALAALLALAVLLVAPPAFAKHDQGERVEVTGLVTDTAGQPLSGVRVVLEASRAVFSIRSFRRELQDTRRVAAVTGDRGQFELVWPWDGYFNYFELVVGVPVRTPDGERFEVLERQDVSPRIKQSNPMVITLQVENAAFVRTLQAFLASIDTDDERRVYQQMGKPDRIEERGDERSWWYFGQGRSFVFDGGRLAEVKTFDPVETL